MVELSEVAAEGRSTRTIAVEAEDPGARRGHGARAAPRRPPERLRRTRAQDDARPRARALRRDRRRHELRQAPRRRAPRRTAAGTRSSTAPRSRGSARACTRPARSSRSRCERTADAIVGMVERGAPRGAAEIAAVGDRRDAHRAANSAELVDAVRERCGVGIEVISGEEEARLAYVAATSELERRPGLARRLRHRRRQLAVHVRPRRTGRGALQRRRRRRAVHRALRPRRRRLGRDSSQRRSTRSRPTSRGSTGGRRPTRSSAWAARHEPRRRPARPRRVRPRRRPGHGPRPGRDRPPDRALPHADGRRSGERSSACSRSGPR